MADNEKTNGSPVVLGFPKLKYDERLGPSKIRQIGGGGDGDATSSFGARLNPRWDGTKKEIAMRTWLNRILTPPTFFDDEDNSADRKEVVTAVKKSAAAGDGATRKQAPHVPTKEEASLRIYMSDRWMADLRAKAADLHQTLVPNLALLDEAINDGKIAIRPNKMVHFDVGLKRFVVGILVSVNPIWLRIGFEAVYQGKIAQIRNNNDIAGTKKFMEERLFNDPGLQSTYGVPGVVNVYKDGYDESMARFFLKMVLHLFVFLDRAKRTQIIKHDPRLFEKTAEHKTIKGVLDAIVTELLRGDGNLFKTLSQCNLQVSYAQQYLDEKDYAVVDFIDDFKDGITLCRVVSILTGNSTLMEQLRHPPTSILQKTHNVSVALKALESAGMDVKGINAKDIVVMKQHDRGKMTAMLVDRMMAYFHNIKFDDGLASLAITFIRFQAQCRGLLIRKRFVELGAMELAAQDPNQVDHAGSTQMDTANRSQFVDNNFTSVERSVLYATDSEDISTANINASASNSAHILHQNVSILNGGESNDDSEKFPQNLDIDPIAESTRAFTGSDLMAAEVSDGSNNSTATDHSSTVSSFSSLHSVTAEMDIDSISVDVEQRQRLAATAIQSWWRCVYCRSQLAIMRAEQFEVQTAAAIKLQAGWRAVCARKQAAKRRAELEEQKRNTTAAITVQAWWRGSLCRNELAKTKIRADEEREKKRTEASIKIQSFYRGHAARKTLAEKRAEARFKLQTAAAVTIQCWWRVVCAKKVAAKRRVALAEKRRIAAIVKVQAWWRGSITRLAKKRTEQKIAEQRKKESTAATKIQALWRGFAFRKKPNNYPATLQAIRQRSVIANSAFVDANTIGARTRFGLKHLLDRKDLTSIRIGLEHLDVATRMAANSCKQLVAADGVKVLFDLIHQMNSSLASNQCTMLAVSILVNVVRYADTRESILAVPKWFESLFKILHKFKSEAPTERTFNNACLILVMMYSANGVAFDPITTQKLRTMAADYVKKEKRRMEAEKQRFLVELGKAEYERRKKDLIRATPDVEDEEIETKPYWAITKKQTFHLASQATAMAWVARTYHLT